MKSKAASRLADIGIWSGADGFTYLKLDRFIRDIEHGAPGTTAAEFMEAFNLVHKVFEVVAGENK